MDLEHTTISLATAAGIFGAIFGAIATLVAWLGRFAIHASLEKLEERFKKLTEEQTATRAELAKERDRREAADAKINELEKVNIQNDGRIKALGSTTEQALEAAEKAAANSVSRDLFLQATQNQDRTLARIESELARKASVSSMPAVRTIRREEPESVPPKR
jgi:uncharacterized membrane protein YhiD involved in acid resistance